MCNPTSATKRFSCPTCLAKRGSRCAGGRTHKARRSKGK